MEREQVATHFVTPKSVVLSIKVGGFAEGNGKQMNIGTLRNTRIIKGEVLSHPVLEGKPNANYVRARIRTHVHSDYINEHHHTMLE
jgi:hypothetical protein